MPLFEDDTLEGAIRKATAGLGRQRKQDDNLRMDRGFGPYARGAEIPGTGRDAYTTNFEVVKHDIGREFERLARLYYERQSNDFDNNRFDGNMIPELHTDIFGQEFDGGEIQYGYSPIKAGIVTPGGHGRSDFEYRTGRRTTVAVLHAHWVDMDCSSSRGFGRPGIDSGGLTDERAIRNIRRDLGNQVRLYVYRWNGDWGDC